MKRATKLHEKSLNQYKISWGQAASRDIEESKNEIQSHACIENQILANIQLSQRFLNLVSTFLNLLYDFPIPFILNFLSSKCFDGLIVLDRFVEEEFLLFLNILFGSHFTNPFFSN